MRLNTPVTQCEFDYPADTMLVSTTDTRGYITHCNAAFVAVSGYRYDDLIGQNHNLIRHPDVPAAAFKDLWQTIGRGHPWSGIVKNRRFNGDHYWVHANVTPIMLAGKPVGYMSVRTKPSRQQIEAAQALYQQINEAVSANKKLPVYLQGGELLFHGPRGWLAGLMRTSPTLRLGLTLTVMIVLAMVPGILGVKGLAGLALELGTLLIGATAVMVSFHQGFTRAIDDAKQFANEIAGCNLATQVRTNYPAPMGELIRSLRQIQINLRAVVGDVQGEITSLTDAATRVAEGGRDLSERTNVQAASLDQAASSMDELSGNVRQTADTAQQVSVQSEKSNEVAMRGGDAVHQVETAMTSIETSSGKVKDIVGVIEAIAFQTNLLALNAAVEAARAGEQGRGFAVVAAEVRGLAKRSAAAAKEIHDLIIQSTTQIAEGSKQMTRTGATIDQVVESVGVVSELIKQISNATQEQAAGIALVNEAVNQLDAATQQNASLVNMSADAAAQLQEGAQTLAKSLQVFHLPPQR